MLIQQGLEEIASVSTSEQIAFLLVERARLLDELEAEQNRTMTPSVDGRASEDLQKTLEKERNEFEEEISQQRDSLKKTQDQLKRQHEEEINALMEENNKLEDDLVESKEKVRHVDHCLSFCPFSFGHCVVCSFQFTNFDSPCGIFKLFLFNSLSYL